MSSRVLITGAAGFIGSHVARLASQQSSGVYVLVRPATNTWRIRDLLPQVHTCECDLADIDAVRRCLSQVRPRLCVHLAWFAEPGAYWQSLENLASLTASLNLVRALPEAGCERIAGIGTCAEYDVSDGPLSEGSAVRPRSLYAATKSSLASILEQLGPQRGLQTAWLRLFWQYGPYEDPRRLVPYVICSLLRGEVAALQDAERIVDYLHVADVAAAIWAVATSSLTGSVNVGSADPVSIADVGTGIARLIGRQDLLRTDAGTRESGGTAPVYADNSQLRATGWQPQYGLTDGLQHTIAWWRAQLRRSHQRP